MRSRCRRRFVRSYAPLLLIIPIVFILYGCDDDDVFECDDDFRPPCHGLRMVCHDDMTIWVHCSALPEHLEHGDIQGPCPEDDETPDESGDDEVPDDCKRMICHKPGTPAEATMLVPCEAWPGHEQHGDYQGACQSEPV